MDHQENTREICGDITNSLCSILGSCSLGKRVRKRPSKFNDHVMGDDAEEEVIPKKRARGRTVAPKRNANEDAMIQDENNAEVSSQNVLGRSRGRTVRFADGDDGDQIPKVVAAAASSRQRTVPSYVLGNAGIAQNRMRTRTCKILKPKEAENVKAAPSRPTRTRTTKSKEEEKKAPITRSRTVKNSPPVDDRIIDGKRKRTRTTKVLQNEAIKLLPQDESSRSTRRRTRARTIIYCPPKEEPKNAPRSRTRQRTSKAELQSIVDCKIEGLLETFDVCRKMLSEKSEGFKTLFAVNHDDLIVLEGIPDRTLEIAFRYCHGYALKECSYEDLFSVLNFADAWEIPELKAEIEERLAGKLLPSNVVKICNRTFSMSDTLQTTCKEYMLQKHINGQKIANFDVLIPQIQNEMNQSLTGSQRIRCRTTAV